MNPEDKLCLLRKSLGLNQDQIAEIIGVSRASISYFEQGFISFSSKSNAHKKIMLFLNGKDENPLLELDKQLNAEQSRKSIEKTFVTGKCYRIYSSGNIGHYGGVKPSAGMGGTAWEYDCIFMFLRKEGIHHVFREIRGGWTRTYTDAQLIGKHIQEVKP